MAPPGGRVGKVASLSLLSFVCFVRLLYFMHMIFEVCVFGHSYVRDLSHLGKSEIVISDNIFKLNFVSVPGATFSTFLSDPTYFEHLKSQQPDFVIVILGGNDLKADVELSVTYENCRKFYEALRVSIPDSVMIAN